MKVRFPINFFNYFVSVFAYTIEVVKRNIYIEVYKADIVILRQIIERCKYSTSS